MPGPWVVGSLFSQLWPMSDAGGAPETNVFSWQYFINYNFVRDGRYRAFRPSSPTGTRLRASSGVPFGAGITRTVVFKGQPMSLGFQYFKNVEKPDDAPGTQARFNVSFIFPMKP